MLLDTADLASSALSWRTGRNMTFCLWFWPICSIMWKHRCHPQNWKYIAYCITIRGGPSPEPWPQVMCTENSVKLHLWTYRHTDCNTLPTYWGWSDKLWPVGKFKINHICSWCRNCMKMCTHTLSLLHMLEGTRYFVDYEKEYAILTQMILFQLNNLPNYDLLI